MADSDDAAIIGSAIAFVGLLLAGVIGITQFPDARLFVCSQLSLLCDRDNDPVLTYVDFVNGGDLLKIVGARLAPDSTSLAPNSPPSDEMYGNAEGWSALMSLKNYDKRSEQQCLAGYRGAELQPGFDRKDDAFKFNKSEWQFHIVPLNEKTGIYNYQAQQNRTLLIDIISKYAFPLKRSIQYTIDIDDIYNYVPIVDPGYRGRYVFTHPEGTDSYWVECQVYFPGPGLNQFRIRFTDDLYHTDQTKTVSVMIEPAP